MPVSGLCGTEWTISAGEHVVTVVEIGAGLQSYRVGDTDVTCPYPTDALPPRACGTTLVPWPNRIRGARYDFDGSTQQLAASEPDTGNAIHGLGRWSRWSRVRRGDPHAELTLRFDVPPQKGYPFPVRCETTYRLDPDDGLTVTITARNGGDVPAPFGAGQHPYLATHGHRIDDVTLQLPARTGIELDESGIPVGSHRLTGADDFRRGRRLRERRFDDAFTDFTRTDGRAVFELRTRSGSTRLWCDESFEYAQVFTVDELTAGRPGIAVEPMSCPANAFNSGDRLVVLEPGVTWSGTWGVAPL